MKRIHFDSKGPVPWHYFFWEPWGCGGCLLRVLGFVLLLALFLFLLSQFRSCRSDGLSGAEVGALPGSPLPPTSVVVPPINEDDIIEDDGRRLVGNRLNVLFDAECGMEEVESWHGQFRALYPDTINRVVFFDPDTKLMGLQVDSEKREYMLEHLNEQIPDIPFLVFEEDVLGTADYQPNDPVFNNSEHAYHYSVIQAPKAWGYSTGNPSVVVAVVDDFFDLSHPDLAGLDIVYPHSVTRGSEDVSLPSDYNPRDPEDDRSHGTHTGSLAVGAMDDGVGIAGIAPKCKFMPISIGDPIGSLAEVQGVLYAVNHGATVINISIGTYWNDEIVALPLESQVEISREFGAPQERLWNYIFEMCKRNYITIVWAAGNQNCYAGMDTSKRNPYTIRVSAIDSNLRKANFSNFGYVEGDSILCSDLSAPGVAVAAAKAGTRGYTLVPGTSFSAPIVAGCVGLIKSQDPTLSTQEIIELLQTTGRPAQGPGANTIGPVVQIGQAMEKLATELPRYDEFKQAVAEGNSSASYKIGRLFYQEIADSAALPPIYVVTIHPTGANRGEIRYANNRTPQSVFKSTYTATSDDESVTFTVAPATRLEGDAEGIAATRAEFVFRKADNGNPYMSAMGGDWFRGEFFNSVINRN